MQYAIQNSEKIGPDLDLIAPNKPRNERKGGRLMSANKLFHRYETPDFSVFGVCAHPASEGEEVSVEGNV